MSDEIYLDCAATTPLDPRVAAAMAESFERYPANPSSTHAPGRRARRAVEDARERVAARLGVPPRTIVFTSGATESNNLALQGTVLEHAEGAPHLVTTRIEHKSVLDTARALERRGLAVTYVECDADGVVPPDRVAEAIRPNTVLVSVMHVNNETGVVQDIPAIAALCRARGVPLHVDAAQSVGKLELDLDGWGVDLCSMTAHKLHGPKGVGALYVREGVRLTPLLHGGEQERGLRPGTLATQQIVGMGRAYELADPARDGPRLAALRDRLERRLGTIPGARLNGARERRAPHIVNMSFPGVDGESLRFAVRDVAVSAGSACMSDSPEASHVLGAMGLSDALAGGALRLSVGRFTTEREVDEAAGRVAAAVERLRALAAGAPAWCSG
ncbi:MAG TPA: cysteine desulfurase family protein [Gammaproteobacteria bacterium]